MTRGSDPRRTSRRRSPDRTEAEPSGLGSKESRRIETRISALDDPIEVLPRIGPARASALRAVGIETVRDLLFRLPIGHRRRPPERSIAAACAASRIGDSQAMIRGTVTTYRSGRRRGSPSRLSIVDATGSLEVVAFSLRRVPQWMRRGKEIVVEGRVEAEADTCRIFATHCAAPEEVEDAGALRPHYELPAAIPPREYSRWIRACGPLLDEVSDPRDPRDLARVGLPALSDSLRAMHAPRDERDVEVARRRFALEELATHVSPLAARKRALDRLDKGRSLRFSATERSRLLARLSFSPTSDQRAALDTILDDLERRRPMHRLLHGEVGSGKTAVALCALLAVAEAGFPCALLAPTAPLARQHVESARALFATSGIPVHEVSAAVAAADRRATIERLRVPHSCLVIGTLRLLSAIRGVAFAVIDEQQRFGVSQRARMRANPGVDLLVMTATPIPRSLALVFHGDLDVSVLRELPAGRGARETRALMLEDAHRWRLLLAAEVAAGGRAFVICPSIRGDDAWTVESVLRALRGEYGPESVAVAHGSRTAEENARAIASFRDGPARVLVSTVLLEVGIDIPDATAMIVLGADRFGLSQLHQLRGRVGRGSRPSRCLLVSTSASETARERIAALVGSDSGFEIAEADLRLRGAGELVGEAQHGAVDFRFARFPFDLDLLPLALESAATAPRALPGGRAPDWFAVGPG